MPAVSFYLSQDLLNAVRERARAQKIPVSRIISEAVREYLKLTENVEAKKRVLKYLSEKKPFGGMEGWERLHKERTEADAGRS